MTAESPQLLDDFLDALAEKWKEVPSTTQGRIFSSDLLTMPDEEFLRTWQEMYDNNCCGQGYSVRGWYHDLYSDFARRGERWLEIGSGLGFDGTFFASQGAHVTFLDIVPDNLKIIERVCQLKNIGNVGFFVMEGLADIKRLGQYDCIMAIGSLINAPFEMMCEERREFAEHLVEGGRWLELCYPEERWDREGRLPFDKWGAKTDGERTPWVEWYDIDKLLQALKPHQFETIAQFNFHNDDFNWFDVVKRG